MSSHETTAPETSVLDYEPSEEQDEWLEDSEELPRRPRRRLLTPIPLALLAVLLIACGFVAGVEVQKGQTSSASGAGAGAGSGSGSGLASRLAALGGSPPAGATGSASSTSGSGSKGAAGAFPGAGGSGSGGVTTGEVAYVRGNTLYVTDSQGNTVKVSAAAGSKVTKTVSTKAKSIHPGQTVVVLGSKAKNGSISASSISVSSAASGSATGAGGSSSGSGSSTGGEAAALFGSG
jgi:hypothetical protein